jgi:hypothetical protein
LASTIQAAREAEASQQVLTIADYISVLGVPVAYPGIFSGWGGYARNFFQRGFNKFSYGQTAERMGICGQ